jgi:hypothetical protein
VWKSKLRALLDRRDTDTPATVAKSPPIARNKAIPANPYRSVSVVPGSKCCAAVKALAQRKFLVQGAPLLPLPDCTMSAQCKCSFRKHDERRDQDRRLGGELGKWYGGTEKRRSRGRRSKD